jgi:hypothetical protein
MSNTLYIRFKATGEFFNIPYQLQTTIHELIEYVCTHSTIVSKRNPNDYYLAINNSDMLENHRTVEETGLNQLDRIVSLDVCIKTQVLIKRILQSRMEFWHASVTQVAQDAQQTTTAEELNNIGMKRERIVDLKNINNLIFFYLIQNEIFQELLSFNQAYQIS